MDPRQSTNYSQSYSTSTNASSAAATGYYPSTNAPQQQPAATAGSAMNAHYVNAHYVRQQGEIPSTCLSCLVCPSPFLRTLQLIYTLPLPVLILLYSQLPALRCREHAIPNRSRRPCWGRCPTVWRQCTRTSTWQARHPSRSRCTASSARRVVYACERLRVVMPPLGCMAAACRACKPLGAGSTASAARSGRRFRLRL